jgi:hypothetical protein
MRVDNPSSRIKSSPLTPFAMHQHQQGDLKPIIPPAGL